MRIDEQIINIIFDAGKGAQPVSSREARVGEQLGELPVPVRFGYSFEGWYMGDERVDAGSVIAQDYDLRLTARWTKKKGEKKRSTLKKQKIAVFSLAAVILVLIVSLIIVNRIVSVTEIVDQYYDENTGEIVSRVYYVKKVDDQYSLYDEDDIRMEVNTYGFHIAHSGNQYEIDQTTGECTLYALVDSYDANAGELLGHAARVMMFAQIDQSDVYSIEVKNENGEFTVLRYPNGTAYLKGTENKLNLLNDNAFASLAVSCGYTLTTEKLDFSSPYTPRLPDGSVDYSAYGLSEADDPIVYTITKRATDANGNTCAATGEGASYTVMIGDKILSGGGYYAKLVGRDSVYIFDASIASTLLGSSEVMLSPTAIYPMGVSDYIMVEDFLLESVSTTASNGYYFITGAGSLVGTKNHIVDFSFWDLLDREGTMNTPYPYKTSMPLMEGYFLDTDSISLALESIYRMEVSSCLKGDITPEAIKEYIFNGNDNANVHHLSFRYNVLDREAILLQLSGETDEAFMARVRTEARALLIENGYSEDTVNGMKNDDLMKEITRYGLCVEDGVLYDKYTHLNEVYSYCCGVLIDLGYTVEQTSILPDSFVVDNSDYESIIRAMEASVISIVGRLEAIGAGVYYDDETNEVYVINELLISEKIGSGEDAKYNVAVSLYDMIVEVDAYHFDFLDWNTKEWYSQYFTWMQISYMTDLEIVDKEGNSYTFEFENMSSGNSKNMKIFYYVNGNIEDRKLLDYSTEGVDALTNFREFYEVLMYTSLEGSIDQKQLNLMAQMKDKNGEPMTPDKFRELPDSECSAIVYMRAEDSRLSSAKVIRFYNYSETGSTYVTIDVVDAYETQTDENGNQTEVPTTNWRSQSIPTDGQGKFYIKTSHLDTLLEATRDVIDGKLIASTDRAQ